MLASPYIDFQVRSSLTALPAKIATFALVVGFAGPCIVAAPVAQHEPTHSIINCTQYDYCVRHHHARCAACGIVITHDPRCEDCECIQELPCDPCAAVNNEEGE